MAKKQQKDYEERSSDGEEIGEEIGEDEDSPPTINPYEVLGLEGEATADDVKKAYRKMALKHHPGILSWLFFRSDADNPKTRPQRAKRKLQTRSSRRSHSHTPFSQTTADASATTSRAALRSLSRMTKILIGSASTVDSSRISSTRRLSTSCRMSTRTVMRSGEIC